MIDLVHLLLTLLTLAALALPEAVLLGIHLPRLRYAVAPGIDPVLTVGCVLAVAAAVQAVITHHPTQKLAPPARYRAAELAQPMSRAHAHNDYEHEWPLLDAIDHGFTSVEADVWLVDGQLMVAHDRDDVVPGWTLERMYLSPLEVLRRSNGGTIYPERDAPFELLIDVKSDAAPTYAALQDVLARHARLLTTVTDGRTRRRAVTAVISGNQDRAAMLASPTRYAGYDGRLADLDSQVPASVMPLVSPDWTETFTWDGSGEMPAAEEQELRDIVRTAHDHGYRVRFWNTPDEPGPARDAVWRKLVEVGVDEISTDDLAGLQEFLSA